MPDPSGEPTLPSREQPGVARPAAGPSHLAPAPRAHLAAMHPARESAGLPPPPPPGFRAVLEWLRQYGNLDLDPEEGLGTAPETARAWQARLTRDQRKFHKFDPEHPQPTAAAAEPASTQPGGALAAAPEDASGGDFPRGITAEQIAYIRRLRAESAERRLWYALGITIIAFLVLAGAFLASHFSKIFAHPPEPAAASPKPPAAFDGANVPPAGGMDLLDQAMAAERAAEYGKAIEILERAQHGAGHIHGLTYRLAALCYEANEMPQVLPLLNLSIAQGEEVAACYSLRGTLSNQVEGTPQEPGDLEKATLLEPLEARYFFVWGEALRRAGKFERALLPLQRAADRLQEPALAPMYGLKLRLSQLELGRREAFAAEMAEKLKEVPVPVDWLLTEAAASMKDGDLAGAAAALAKVRLVTGERELARQLDDPFFKPFAHEADLARFFDGTAAP